MEKETASKENKLVEALKMLRESFLVNATVNCSVCLSSRHSTWNEPFEMLNTQGLFSISFDDKSADSCRCEFWVSGKRFPLKTWEVPLANGLDDYETKLFETWSYNDGQSLTIKGDVARWFISSMSAKRLEKVAAQVEKLLKPLFQTKHKDFAEKALKAIRNHSPRWQQDHVQWTYIKELDEVIKKLKVVGLSNEKPAEPVQSATRARCWGIWTCVKKIPRWIYYLVGFLAALLTCIYFLWWLLTTFWPQ